MSWDTLIARRFNNCGPRHCAEKPISPIVKRLIRRTAGHCCESVERVRDKRGPYLLSVINKGSGEVRLEREGHVCQELC